MAASQSQDFNWGDGASLCLIPGFSMAVRQCSLAMISTSDKGFAVRLHTGVPVRRRMAANLSTPADVRLA